MEDKKAKNIFIKFYNAKIFWPVTSLLVLLLFNFIMRPEFFKYNY